MIEDFNISKFAVLSLKVSDIYVFVNFAETGPDKMVCRWKFIFNSK